MTAYSILCAALATLGVSRRIRRCCLVVGYQEWLCVGVEMGLRVMGNTREACDVAALAVVFHATKVGIVLVTLLISGPIENTIFRWREFAHRFHR